MPNLPISPAFLIASFIALIASTLYIREYLRHKKALTAQQTVDLQTRQKSIELINAAQMIQTHVAADGKYVTQKLLEDYKLHLDNLVQSSQKEISTSQAQLIKFMGDIQKRSVDFEQASQTATEKRISELFERLETKLSDFLVTTESKTANSIELELKAARQLIETYKTQQLKLIDENVVAMMEQTINIVLGKKLSLKDQLDLIYEALEKAKVDKFIV